MVKRFDYYLRKFSSWVAGSNVDFSDRRQFLWAVIAIGAPAIVIFFLIALALVKPFIHESLESKKIKYHRAPFTVPVNDYEFIVSYHDFGNENIQKSIDEMWQLKKAREGEEHSIKLNSSQGITYWLGVEIDQKKVANAIENKANIFYLDYLYTTNWQVYINSNLIQVGGGIDIRRPVSLNLKEVLNKNPHGFRINVRIKNDMNKLYPDQLFFTGFANEEFKNKYENSIEFDQLIRNSLSFGVNIALGILFLGLWISSVRKQEMAGFAAFSLIQAFIQGWNWGFIGEYYGYLYWQRISFISSCYELIAILWLGLSIARVRSKEVLAGLLFFLLIPWSVFLVPVSNNDLFAAVYEMLIYGSPWAYCLSAFICFTQARLVSAQYRKELIDSERVLKLNLSWISLLLMAAVIHYGNTKWDDYRIFNSFLILGLVLIVIHNYKKQEQYIRKAPLSKYHQKAQLPEKIPCVLGTIDLKSSELLYKFGSTKGVGGAYVVEIISKFYQYFTEKGAEVIQTEGDAITFFFDSEENKNSFSMAVETVKHLNSVLGSHIKNCQSTIGTEYPTQIHLRAALDIGAIKPAWQYLEGREVPIWQQAQDSNVFVDVARLLEAEAQLVSKNGSSLVVKNEIMQSEQVNLADLATHSSSVKIKHGRNLDVSIATL